MALAALIAWRLKRYYADASVDDLRWILDPTSRLVTLATGARFEWAPGEGYLSRERLFVIEKVCAGINFMIAAFGMVAWMLRRRVVAWLSGAGVLVASLLAAYSAAVVVNAARIAFAMWLAGRPDRIPWLTAAQAHRVEGIAFYFAGLVLLFELVRQADHRMEHGLTTPLIWYYGLTLAIPLANGAGGNSGFLEHAAFVAIVPLVLVACCCMLFSRVPARVTAWFVPGFRPLERVVPDGAGRSHAVGAASPDHPAWRSGSAQQDHHR